MSVTFNPLENAIKLMQTQKRKHVVKEGSGDGQTDEQEDTTEHAMEEIATETGARITLDDIRLYKDLAAAYDQYTQHRHISTDPTSSPPTPNLLALLSDFCCRLTDIELMESAFRALGLLLVSRDHLLVVDQLQTGYLKGQVFLHTSVLLLTTASIDLLLHSFVFMKANTMSLF